MANSKWSANKFDAGKHSCNIVFGIVATIIFNTFCYGQPNKDQPPKFDLNALTSSYSKNYFGSIFDKKIPYSVQIVGLGEVSHGGYEPMAFKANMIKYLIEAKGYRKLLLEMGDFGPLRTLRKYLNNENNIDTTYITQWVKSGGFPDATLAVWPDLFKWIKKYNLNHPKNKVDVMGFDVSESDKTIDFILTKYIIPFNYIESRQFTPTLGSAMPLSKWLTLNEAALKAKLSPEDFYWLCFYIHNAQNSLNYYTKKSENDPAKSDSANLFRDSIMSKNVRYLGGADRCIIWAHNGHVIRGEIKYMGNYLNQYYGNKYFVVATDFSKYAAVQVYRPDSMKVDHKRYPAKIFKSSPATAAYNILDKYGVSEGIFFREDLTNMKIKEGVNLIDVGGFTLYFPEYHNLFDALVVFSNIYPTPK